MMNTAFDKVADRFATLMLEKIEAISEDWKKPWFSGNKINFFPQNISGRFYTGGNTFCLSLLCDMHNFQTPVFLTFNQAKEKGISILKGAVSFPVYYAMLSAYNLNTQEKISIEEFKLLSPDEKEEYHLGGSYKYYSVFNLEQTNFMEIFPGEWKILKQKFTLEIPTRDEYEMYSNPVLDKMLLERSWICPIAFGCNGQASYSAKQDRIILPEKKNFFNGEAFYCTELHEMVHSTGTKERLNRDGFYLHDNENYGREELVAEFAAALTAFFLGISMGIREENASYLKGWIANIKKEPKFLMSVLNDSMKAVKFISNQLGINLICNEEMEIQQVA